MSSPSFGPAAPTPPPTPVGLSAWDSPYAGRFDPVPDVVKVESPTTHNASLIPIPRQLRRGWHTVEEDRDAARRRREDEEQPTYEWWPEATKLYLGAIAATAGAGQPEGARPIGRVERVARIVGAAVLVPVLAPAIATTGALTVGYTLPRRFWRNTTVTGWPSLRTHREAARRRFGPGI